MTDGGSPADHGVLLCITPNPAIDRTAHVPRIKPGEILRPSELVVLPGGKGVNAARSAARLGGSVITTGIAGGHAGRWLVEALAAEGLEGRWATAAAEARTTYVTLDEAGEAVIVYERPTVATEAEFAAFLVLLTETLLPRVERAIVAGSAPAGVGRDALARIVDTCQAAGVPLLVDATGDSLLAALEHGPDIVKIGRIEVEHAGLTGSKATAAEAAAALVDAGARLAIVTDGASGVAATDGTMRWQADVPRIDAVNAVGSGDAFNAGLSLALMDGATTETALARAVAAGSANALALAGGMLDAGIARQLEARVHVTRQTEPEPRSSTRGSPR